MKSPFSSHQNPQFDLHIFSHAFIKFFVIFAAFSSNGESEQNGAEKPMVIFSKSSCCMSHTINSRICEFGVNPAVYELYEIPRGGEIEQALLRFGCNLAVPAVFIGGEFVGGANEIMSLLPRSSKPVLKRAGALWV